jgi:MarR family transcriptional regulator, negative regulator of the multidrug operon emrRAB
MTDRRLSNLLGALALGLVDRQTVAVAAAAQHGASAPAALVSIGADPGLSIDALARTIGLSHSACVRLAERLVNDGLVTRQSAHDGRAVALHLTDQGATTRQKILTDRAASLHAAIAGLTPQEQQSLAALLEKMLHNLVDSPQRADHLCRLCDEEVCPAATCPVELCALALVPGLRSSKAKAR